jgi:response regulator RpfG family c-di-GMP phosphodiesterase
MKILILENDTASRQNIQNWLRERAYQTVAAYDGAEARAYLQQQACDVLLCERTLPDGDGLTLCRQLRKENCHIWFLLISERPETDAPLLREAGVDDLLRKPIAEWELALRLESARRTLALQDKCNQREMEHEAAQARLSEVNMALEREHKALSEAHEQLQMLFQRDMVAARNGGDHPIPAPNALASVPLMPELLSVWGNVEALAQEPAGELLLGVLAVLERRQAGSQGHAQRVALIALRLAGELKRMGVSELDSRTLHELALGALLHDIGKTALPDSLLNKPGPLDAEEREQIHRYPILGIEMLQHFPLLAPALPVARHQHERWDGNGYPDGLKGADIPLSARIFSLSNAFDAMCSDRPYRKALSFAEARAQIESGKGQQFDPVIVHAFCSIPETEWNILWLRAAHDSALPLFAAA